MRQIKYEDLLIADLDAWDKLIGEIELERIIDAFDHSLSYDIGEGKLVGRDGIIN